MREKRAYYEAHPEEVDKILKEGTERARKTAKETIKKVKVNWNNNTEDFGEFMANAKKNKPVIQQEKERFLDRMNKEKEKQLMKEKDLLKEQVLKFEL